MQYKFAKSPAIILTIFFTIGILIQKSFDFNLSILVSFLALNFFVAIYYRKNQIGIIFFGFLFLLTGAINYGFWEENNLKHPIISHYPLDNRSIIGIVKEPPSNDIKHFFIRSTKLIESKRQFNINHLFMVKLNEPISSLFPGDQIILKNVDLDKINAPRNPGQFNYRTFLKSKGIIGVINLTSKSEIRLLHRAEKFSIQGLLYGLREKIISKINDLLPLDNAKFLSAIILGKKESISPDIKLDFQNSGVAHILAISGLHVGFVVCSLFVCLSFLPVSFRWHNILTIVLLLFYMLLTGSNPPVVRATLMVSIYLIGKNLEKKIDIYNSIFFAAFLILIIQPQQIFWTGFQFSFIAVLSIVFFYRQFLPLETRIVNVIQHKQLKKWFRYAIVAPFFVSLSAQLGTLPLIAIYFHKIPLISLILNIVVIPIVGIIVPVGFLLIICSLLHFQLGLLIGSFLSSLIDLLIFIVGHSANLPYAYIHIPKFSIIVLFLYFVILWLGFSWTNVSLKVFRLPVFLLFVVCVLWISLPQKQNAEIIMLDVGQGEASLVRTPLNKYLLFDTGPANSFKDSGKDVIFPAVQNMGNLHIDKVIISHPHADHIAGLYSLVNLVSIDSIYLPKIQIPYVLQDSLTKILKSRGIPFRYLKCGDIIRVDLQTRIYILAPFFKSSYCVINSERDLNNASIVAILRMGESSILFTGDAEGQVERHLLLWDSILKVDILKVGHHGSITSTTKNFLNKVNPGIGLIPVGSKNRYNHPSPVIIKRLMDMGVKHYRTDKEGAIWFQYINRKWKRKFWN